MKDSEKLSAMEIAKQIAWIAWKGGANAYRLYPDSKHTFTDYWGAAETQFQHLVSEIETLQVENEMMKKQLEKWLEMTRKELHDFNTGEDDYSDVPIIEPNPDYKGD